MICSTQISYWFQCSVTECLEDSPLSFLICLAIIRYLVIFWAQWTGPVPSHFDISLVRMIIWPKYSEYCVSIEMPRMRKKVVVPVRYKPCVHVENADLCSKMKLNWEKGRKKANGVIATLEFLILNYIPELASDFLTFLWIMSSS